MGRVKIVNDRVVREETQQDHRLRLDLTRQVLRLDIPEDRASFGEASLLRENDATTAPTGPLTPSQTAESHPQSFEAPVHATLADMRAESFVSASVLAFKAKQFDDGLYAAVELAAQEGLGDFSGKGRLLESIGTRLARQGRVSDGLSIVLAACRLGGHTADANETQWAAAQGVIDDFLRDSLSSKPLGFYSWSERLSRIFQQDRVLQTPLETPRGLTELSEALRGDPHDRDAYARLLELIARLTNPFSGYDLRPFMQALNDERQITLPDDDAVRFFPPSKSHEGDLVKRLYGAQPIPEGFSLADAFIEHVRSGRVVLSPRPDSGWYDIQTWALESLVRPEVAREAPKLRLSEAYREQLLELLKGILALTRETHVKQLEIPLAAGAAPFPFEQRVIELSIRPHLTVEPLAEYYCRRAQGYRFVREHLAGFFGAAALNEMRRLTQDGPVDVPLGDELERMAALFHGACCTSLMELGVVPHEEHDVGSARGVPEDISTFQGWVDSVNDDIDLTRDGRMMVPVFYDLERRKTKVWAFLGWSQKRVRASFAERPVVDVFAAEGRQLQPGRFTVHAHSLTRPLAYPVTAEIYVSNLLDRSEFRSHCDRFRTPSQILANLT
jgi:hypothetical protein